MWIVPLLVTAGVAAYVMTPEERRRAIDVIARLVRLPEPDAFDNALRARTPWPAVTIALVGINVAVFVFVVGIVGASDPETLVSSGASTGPLTTNGEWWRLVSAAFVHTGVLHLLVNIAGLVQIAVIVERLAGHAAVAFTYVAAGVLATLLALWTDPVAVTTASSPAVFGVCGAFLAAWLWGTLRPSVMSIPLRSVRRVVPALALFLLYQFVTSGLNAPAGVALLAGMIGGLLLSPGIAARRPSARQFAVPSAAAAVFVVAMAVPVRGITDIRPELARVVEMEERTSAGYLHAVERFRNGTTTAAGLSKYIKVAIVPELQVARERLNGLDRVPPQHAHLVAAAREYLALRDRSWTLRMTALTERKLARLSEADLVERESRAALDIIRADFLLLRPQSAP